MKSLLLVLIVIGLIITAPFWLMPYCIKNGLTFKKAAELAEEE